MLVSRMAPFADGEIILRMVIQGRWCRLIFGFDNERFRAGGSRPTSRQGSGRPACVYLHGRDR